MASPERLLTCGSKHPMPTSPRAFQFNGVYTQRFNRTHGRVGHVFQGRFKAILVHKDSYPLELARYVVLNPLRAKRVRQMERCKRHLSTILDAITYFKRRVVARFELAVAQRDSKEVIP